LKLKTFFKKTPLHNSLDLLYDFLFSFYQCFILPIYNRFGGMIKKHCYTGFTLRDYENKEEEISMSKLPNSNSDNGVRPTEDRPPRTPRWVKVSGIIAIVLVLLVVGLMLFGGGQHGPMRHMPSSSGIEQEVKQP
jgi:hypothetical protein